MNRTRTLLPLTLTLLILTAACATAPLQNPAMKENGNAVTASGVPSAPAVSPAMPDITPPAPRPSIRGELAGEWSGPYEITSTKWTNRASFTFTRVDAERLQAFGTLRFTVNGKCDGSICNRDIPFSAIQSRDGTQILVRSDDHTVWYTLWWDGTHLKGKGGSFATVDLQKVR